jgi:hypothetical protein
MKLAAVLAAVLIGVITDAPARAADFGFLPQRFAETFNATAQRIGQPFRLSEADCEGASDDLRENCLFKLDDATSLFAQIAKDGGDKADILAAVMIVDDKQFRARSEAAADLFSTMVLTVVKDQSFERIKETMRSIIAGFQPSGPPVTRYLELGGIYFQVNVATVDDDDVPVEERGVHIELAAATAAKSLAPRQDED